MHLSACRRPVSSGCCLKRGTGPTASGSHSTNSHFLRVDETTGDYIAMADDPAGQAGKLFLWGPIVADDVNSLVIAAGSYVTTSGGTTISGSPHRLELRRTVAWETFWVTEPDAGPFTFNYVNNIVYNPTLGALYVQQNGNLNNRFCSLNLTTGTHWRGDVPRDRRRLPSGDGQRGRRLISVDSGGGTNDERRYTLTGTPSYTSIQTTTNTAGSRSGRHTMRSTTSRIGTSR